MELPENYIHDGLRHDAISWAVVQGEALGRIMDVRRALGMRAHIRLEMLLARNMSFRKMGSEIYPSLDCNTSCRKVAAQCSFLLEQLHEFYSREKRNWQTVQKNAMIQSLSKKYDQ